MGVVVFDYSAWALRYPELSGSVNSALATLYFVEATLYLDNSDCSVVVDVTQRATLLNMITAHIAQLNAPIGGQASSPLVGRIETATEGSVSVGVKYSDQVPGSMAWFIQTKYGAAFWAASAAYRTMRYVPAPHRNRFGGGRGFGFR